MALAQMLLNHVKASLSWVDLDLPILACANHRSLGLGCNDPAR
jgi:hypothetical protein